MTRIPWRHEAPGYEEIQNEDERQYPYFPAAQAGQDNHSSHPKNDYASTLELSSSEIVSPLRVGETTPASFIADFPLVPPVVEEKPRPRLVRRTSSISRGRRSRSSDPTIVRRRLSKDAAALRKTVMESMDQKDSDENAKDSQPKRRKSLEESQKFLGFYTNKDIVNDNDNAEAGVHKIRTHDGNHRHHRTMARAPRSHSPTHRRRRSSSTEKRGGDLNKSNHSQNRGGDLNKSNHSQKRRHHQEPHTRRSDPELKTKSTSVEGTDGCFIIKRTYGVEKPRSFQDKSQSKQLTSPPQRGLDRASSHRKSKSRSPPPPRGLNRSSSHRNNESKFLSPPHRGLLRAQSYRNNNSRTPPQRGLIRSKSQENGLKSSPPQRGLSRSNSQENGLGRAPAPQRELNKSESRRRLETKLAKLEEMKAAKQQKDNDDASQFKLKPPSFRKKEEISEIFNQANERQAHFQRFSAKRIESGASSEDDDDDDEN